MTLMREPSSTSILPSAAFQIHLVNYLYVTQVSLASIVIRQIYTRRLIDHGPLGEIK